jgi:3-oxoacyl-[acyl-carrier protein] reductase
VVTPGLIETEMTENISKDAMLPAIPLGRYGTCEEVTGVVNFLLGPESSYITGQVLSVNGGLYM